MVLFFIHCIYACVAGFEESVNDEEIGQEKEEEKEKDDR